jgi:hypothetical protein
MTNVDAVRNNHFPTFLIQRIICILQVFLFKEAGIEIPAVAHLLNAHEKFIRQSIPILTV